MRTKHNLSHLAHIIGQIGRIQTIGVIPVIAGDSIELNIDGILRLATTRKEIVSECQVDILAFFVKHRHVYGTTWSDYIKLGIQNDLPLAAGPAIQAGARDCFYLGIRECDANVNRALIYGQNFIYQRYFAVPTTETNGMKAHTDLLYYPDSLTNSDHINTRRFGQRAARLPHILNGGTIVNGIHADGLLRTTSTDDWGLQLPAGVPPATAVLDIRDLKSLRSRYKSVQQQNYLATFYNDVMEEKWGVHSINSDADPRPDYLGRVTTFVSGADVNGTDDATLGSFVGKTLDRISFRMGRKIFLEHGNLWIMILPRFPLVHTREQHPLLARAQPDKKLLFGDPDIWSGEQPVAFDPGNWMAGGSVYAPNVDTIAQPYGQEYRYQPNRIHPVFEQIPGYPFTRWDTALNNDWYYYVDNEYVDTFQTSQLAQWQAHMNVTAFRYSGIPAASTSIFAGA